MLPGISFMVKTIGALSDWSKEANLSDGDARCWLKIHNCSDVTFEDIRIHCLLPKNVSILRHTITVSHNLPDMPKNSFDSMIGIGDLGVSDGLMIGNCSANCSVDVYFSLRCRRRKRSSSSTKCVIEIMIGDKVSKDEIMLHF